MAKVGRSTSLPPAVWMGKCVHGLNSSVNTFLQHLYTLTSVHCFPVVNFFNHSIITYMPKSIYISMYILFVPLKVYYKYEKNNIIVKMAM